MITFLSSPKAFDGGARANQIAAIESWRAVHPDAEVILYGDAPGSREVAKLLGVMHVASIASSAAGTPLFGAIADHAAMHARFDVQVYLNCDILLTGHILEAVEAAHFPRYLIVGQRIDLSEDATRSIHTRTGVPAIEIARRNGAAALHPPNGVDYFIFPRGLWTGLPAAVVGRAGYDAALLAFCLRRDIPVIDATFAIPALHQFHDYAHVAGGKREVVSGVDARGNRRIHDIEHSAPTIADATWRIIDGRIVRNRSRGDVLRQLETYLRYRRNLKSASYGVRALWRVLTGLGVYRPTRTQLSEVWRSLRPAEPPSVNGAREAARRAAQ